MKSLKACKTIALQVSNFLENLLLKYYVNNLIQN